MILDDVQADNWRACTALEVDEPQQRFVASVAYYLALCAYGDSPWRPLAVRAGDEVVGFVMWGIDPADESFWIGGLINGCHRERMGRLGRPKWGAAPTTVVRMLPAKRQLEHLLLDYPYQDPQQEAERLKAVHEARAKIVPRI